MAAAEQASRGRGLGVVDASLIVVGCIVGAGIFLVSPYVAREVRSPAAFLATWLFGGAVALAGALSNGELGGLFPRSGGEYVYLREAYGPGLGFLSGWTSFWIGFPGSIAALAAGFGGTLAGMLGVTGSYAPTAIGLAAIAAVTAVNSLGLQPGKWTQNVLSTTKLVAFVALLSVGLLLPGHGSGGLSPVLRQRGPGGGGRRGAHPGALRVQRLERRDVRRRRDARPDARPSAAPWRSARGSASPLYMAINAVYLRALPLAELAQSTDPARAAVTRLVGDRRRPAALAARGDLRAQLPAGHGARGPAHLPGDGERPPLLRSAGPGERADGGPLRRPCSCRASWRWGCSRRGRSTGC